MRREIAKRKADIAALTVLALLASLVALYIVQHQRLRIPLLEPAPVELRLEMETAQAVMPGQGQTVRVSGIRVGDIAGVDLEDGRAIVTVQLDREYDGLVRADATAFLRPKTGLKDMFVELFPGSKAAPRLPEGATIPIRSTLPDVNPDEVLAGLDADTRDYLKLLLGGAGRGLRDRGENLREVLRRFEPTYRDLARVASAGAASRRELRRLVSSLRRLNEALAGRDDDLAELVGNASRVFGALAAERDNVSATVRELPGALRAGSDAFAKVERMAALLGPTVTKLRPAVRSLQRANVATRPFYAEAAPLLARDVRPFVRAARPLVRDLGPGARDLVRAEPGLTRSVRVLNRLFNLIGYNPGGREGPDVADRSEGYLFYLAWLAHQSTNLFSSADAHGPLRPITLGGTCATVQGIAKNSPELEFLLGLTGALTDPNVCGGALP